MDLTLQTLKLTLSHLMQELQTKMWKMDLLMQLVAAEQKTCFNLKEAGIGDIFLDGKRQGVGDFIAFSDFYFI